MRAATASHRLDLLDWPWIGRFLKWRHARTIMQTPLLLMAGLMIFDGLVGPQLAPKNLATVGVWLHYRGLVVLVLLVAGNLFCMACPFMLPRQTARWLGQRFRGGGRAFPRPLQNKWLAAVLVILFFYAYELFDLWASPWLTAWIAVGYFLAALLVDAFFRGAAFCKYVCPLGQFNFFGSLISPLEIKVRDADVCASCRTKDCIRGDEQYRASDHVRGVRGCETWLFQERKVGNLDCTFCLDCAHACPHDNVGLIGRLPTSELWTDRFRSGIGRFSGRLDLAALVAVFVFGGYINAFAMIRPAYALQAWLAHTSGTDSPALGMAVIFLVGLIGLPTALLALAGWGGYRLTGGTNGSVLTVIRRYVYALVPMGFGMWLAHYSFHFLTGALTIVPVVQSFLADLGRYDGVVNWGLGRLTPATWLFPIEATMLYLGALGSLVTAFRIARHQSGDAGLAARPTVLGAALPWSVLTLLLLAAGLWILVQPMEMRGTMMMGS